MNKSIFVLIVLLSTITFCGAQTTAMQINGLDCYDNPVDIFADMDAGKAILLHFYMPDCGSCPPPAQKIQEMANNIMVTYPGMIKAYAFPFMNPTTCSYSASWVEDNDLTLYTPMDSGAAQVAYYGGFGMPTVVLLGGADHRVMFSTLSFVTSDTTEMRDSILNLFGEQTAIGELPSAVSDFNVFPNPASDLIDINVSLYHSADLQIDLLTLNGNKVTTIAEKNQSTGMFNAQYNTSLLANGIYMVKLVADGNVIMKKIIIAH